MTLDVDRSAGDAAPTGDADAPLTDSAEPITSGDGQRIGIRWATGLHVLAALAVLSLLVLMFTRQGSRPVEQQPVGGEQKPAGTVQKPTAAAQNSPPSNAGTPAATVQPGAAAPEHASAPAANPPAAPGAAQTLVHAPTGKCLTASPGGDGMPVVLAPCNGSGAQQWKVRGDGTIVVTDLCLDLPWGAIADGTLLQVAICNGTGAQQFEVNPSQQIVSRLGQKCLQAADADVHDGTRIALRPCGDDPGQKWQKK
jgi:hypothetical protein